MLRNHAPAILFVDEFDAMGAARGGGAGSDESTSIINELLVQVGTGRRAKNRGRAFAGRLLARALPHRPGPARPTPLCLGCPGSIDRLPPPGPLPACGCLQMDGFEDNRGIVVLGATNRPGAIDAALIRPGRFDRIIYMPLPDADGRAKILQARRGRAPPRTA